MACTEEEFLELLSDESTVDITTLTEQAKYGIPDKVRPEVWPYLLHVSKPDKSEEMKLVRAQNQEYEEVDKTIHTEDVRNIRQEIKRYRPMMPYFQNSHARKKFESVMVAYVNYNTDFEYMPNGSLYLAGPMVYLMKKESSAFFCLHGLIKKMEEEGFSRENEAQNVSTFMMFFQQMLPELFTYFEDEEVGPNDWAVSWIRFLLAKELPMDCVLRLWDTYFSCAEGLGLHLYTMLAILVNFHEELIELEHSELKGFLQHLPEMDMDQIIAQAYNIKDDASQRGLL